MPGRLPAAVAASGLARLALLLVLLALVPPAALDLLQHAGAHHLAAEPPEDGLLALVLVHQDLHIVPLGGHHRRRRPPRHVHHGRRRALPRERGKGQLQQRAQQGGRGGGGHGCGLLRLAGWLAGANFCALPDLEFSGFLDG